MSKKAIVTAALAGVLMLSGGGAYAAGQVARSNAIGESSAQIFAFVDAGISPEDASVYKTRFGYENGKFVYEIDFTANGTRYEYEVEASNGKIVSKESETIPGVLPQNVPSPAETAVPGAPAVANNTDIIGVDAAKQLALDRAKLSAGEVTFSKAKLDRDNGRLVYDVEFYIQGVAEYDYEIDASTGTILEESFEEWEQRIASGTSTSSPAVSPAGGSSGTSSGTVAQTPQTSDTQSSSGTQSSVVKQNTQPSTEGQTAAQQGTGASAQESISIEQAKAIALSRAGVSSSDVVFSKAKLDYENGKPVYDIEFYVYGQAEYEYEVDAASGAVIDEDVEPWDREYYDDDNDWDDWDDDWDD